MTVSETEHLIAGEPRNGARWARGYPTGGDVIAARRFLGTCASTGDPQPFGNYEIRRREDGQAIGGVGFHGPADEDGSVTIGYGLIPSARGEGYASEALRGLLLFARSRGVISVKGDTDHGNIASQHVMMAAGMRSAGEDEHVRYFEIAWTDASLVATVSWSRIRTCSSVMPVTLNIADLFEHAVDAAPAKPALKAGDRVLTFAELDADANRLAHFLSASGVRPGEHVALYAKNSIEHVIGLLAILKIRAVAINVNYRYLESELDYLFDNADVVALIHECSYAPLVARCAPRHEKLRTFVVLPDAMDDDCDADVSAFGGVLLEDVLKEYGGERDFGPRSADDIHIIYTGGTTGMPKGVMWRHEDFWRVLGGGIDFRTGRRLSEYDQSEQAREHGRITFPLSPLMHGGAQTGLLLHLFSGELTILEPKFDPVRTWQIIERDDVQALLMTGDAMARPLIEEFQRRAATGRPYQVPSLVVITSTAAIFSPAVKERWIQAFPSAIITDSIGSTETGFQGVGLQDKSSLSHDGVQVRLGPDSVVLDDDNQILDLAGSIGTVGRLGRTGNVPVGYYGDPEKSAATFLVIDGARYSVPGDWARIEADSRVTLLGRGSNCVNTGGEKVYPEEVEAAIKAHPAVYDSLVVGIPDEKYGQAVAAIVELREGQSLDLAGLRTFLSTGLAGYKLPRAMTLVGQVPRNPAGKAQYPRAAELALASDAQRL